MEELAEEFVILKTYYLNCNNHSFQYNYECVAGNQNDNSANSTRSTYHVGKGKNCKIQNGVRKRKGTNTNKAYCI